MNKYIESVNKSGLIIYGVRKNWCSNSDCITTYNSNVSDFRYLVCCGPFEIFNRCVVYIPYRILYFARSHELSVERERERIHVHGSGKKEKGRAAFIMRWSFGMQERWSVACRWGIFFFFFFFFLHIRLRHGVLNALILGYTQLFFFFFWPVNHRVESLEVLKFFLGTFISYTLIFFTTAYCYIQLFIIVYNTHVV